MKPKFEAIVVLDPSGEELGRAEMCNGCTSPDIQIKKSGYMDMVLLCYEDGVIIAWPSKKLRMLYGPRTWAGDIFTLCVPVIECNEQSVDITPQRPISDATGRLERVIKFLRKIVGAK